MENTQNIDIIRRSIMKARTGDENAPNERERFTLVNVLLAMTMQLKVSEIAMEGWLQIVSGEKWNLRNDNLILQSPKTLAFLADLLAHK